MTKSQIATRISQALEDEGLIHFTSTDLSDSINDGYELVTLLCQTSEKVAQITIPANSQIVNMPTVSGIEDFYRVVAIYSETTRRWLLPRTFLNVRKYGVRWSNDTGNCREFCPLGERHLLFYPSPLATQTLQLFYKAEPTDLDTDYTPDFFEDCHKVLEYYSCSDLLDQNLEYSKSLKYYEMFLAEMEEIRVRLNRRGLKSVILELACKFTVTPTSIS